MYSMKLPTLDLTLDMMMAFAEENIIVLPEAIDSDFASQFKIVIALADPTAPIWVHCDGFGGDINATRSIMSFIHAWPEKTIGVITTKCDSSHSLIWSSCNERYVGKYASLGVHGPQVFTETSYASDQQYMQKITAMYTDWAAAIYSEICGPDFGFTYWKKIVSDHGIYTRQYSRDELIAMGMGKELDATYLFLTAE